MYEDFTTKERWSGAEVRCQFQTIRTAVATRHADAADIKFLIQDRPVWIALSLEALNEYRRQNSFAVSDRAAVEAAGHYLKTILESGEESGRELYSLSPAETREHLEAVLREAAAPAK